MADDYLGNPVTPAAPATLAAIDDFVGGLLGYEPRMVRIIEFAACEPGHCLANAYAAAAMLLGETDAAPGDAAPFIAAALAAAPGASAREVGLARAVAAWGAGDVSAADAALSVVLAAHPRDLAAAKLRQYHAFNAGDFPALLRAGLAASAAAPDVAAAHGLAAFGYEQCHLIAEAEAAALAGLALDPREPWSLHAQAHVHLTRGEIAAGATLLDGASGDWARLNSFMSTHLWWHLALFRISEGAPGEALAIYDTHIWGAAPDLPQDQVNAIGLLARIDFAGGDVGQRWGPLAARLAERAGDTALPFLSLHYLVGLARAGVPEAAALMTAIEARAAADVAGGAWVAVAAPAARAIVAHAGGDFAGAATLLGSVLLAMRRIGGSHAQRDLFDQLYLDSLLRSGDDLAAQQILEERRARTPTDVPANAALAGVYARLRLPDLAAARAAAVAAPSSRA